MDDRQEVTSQQLSALITTLPDPLIIVELSTAAIVDWNDQAQTFFATAELPRLSDYSPPSWGAQRLTEELAAAADKHAPLEWYDSDWRGGGWIRLDPCLRLDDERALFRVRDITQSKRDSHRRNRLRNGLERAERFDAAERIAGAVAHDFNNLLAIILNNAELLADSLELDGVASEDLAQIRQAASDASQISQKLLLFGRRDLEKPLFVDAAPTLREIVDEMADEHGRQIDGDFGDQTVFVWVHEGQWREAVQAIVRNALEVTDPDGDVTLQLSVVEIPHGNVHNLAVGEYVRIECSDDGPGMSTPVASRALEPFFTTKSKLGSGLGLSIAYRIATSFGGQIEIETMEGTGTTVTMLLPKHDERGEEIADSELGDERSEDISGATILVVEDEPGVLRAVQRILTAHGFHLLTATNGAEALEVFEGHDGTIELLLTDVVMPGMSGVQLAKKLMRRDESVRVLYMSGYTESALSLDQLVAGKTDLILKPFTATDLLEVIGSHLSQK